MTEHETVTRDGRAAALSDPWPLHYPLTTERPLLVTICGSTKFRAEIAAANRDLTLAGDIVLAPGVFQHTGDVVTEDQKIALDNLHLHKIDLADEVYVVNPGGYLGESTRREIAYALRTGKSVRYAVACCAGHDRGEDRCATVGPAACCDRCPSTLALAGAPVSDGSAIDR
jgi:hypothetical protein